MKCQALTKSGLPCKGKALPGSDYCMAHQPQEEAPEQEVVAVEQDVPALVCGHVNRHYTGPEELTCDLPPFHDGAHEAEFNGGRTAWLDLAGTPAEQIKPDTASLLDIIKARKDAELAKIHNIK